MGRRDSYGPGTFCSVDLETSDAEAAKRFYGSLFGWEAEVPPHWNSYVSDESADDAASRATELGGEVLAGPFDILDVSRMAMLRDPTGATVAVWQAGTFPGVARVNEPGCLTWNELATSDTSKALEFYEALFGWSGQRMDTGDGPEYTVIQVGERSNGGVRPLSPDEQQAGIPPYWVPYFAVESLEATFERCGELGGAKVFGPIDFPGGRIGFLRDPQGATFAIWEGELQD